MKCNNPNSRGQRCEFIRWKPGSSASPQTSESPSLTPPFPVASQAYAPTGSFPIASQPVRESVFYPQRPPGIPHCKTSECGQSRIAPDCWRRLCRKHCIANGGCSSKTHTSATAPAPVPSAVSYIPTTLFSSTTTGNGSTVLHRIFSHPRQPLPYFLLP